MQKRPLSVACALVMVHFLQVRVSKMAKFAHIARGIPIKHIMARYQEVYHLILQIESVGHVLIF